jgi:hypothetical protein
MTARIDELQNIPSAIQQDAILVCGDSEYFATPIKIGLTELTSLSRATSNRNIINLDAIVHEGSFIDIRQ